MVSHQEVVSFSFLIFRSKYVQKHQLHDSTFFINLCDMLQVLDEQYGPSGVAQQGVELLLTTLSKMFGSLQVAYKGQIVGVISFTGTPPSSEKMLNVMFTSQPSARWLAETEDSPDLTAIMKIALVRKTLAWITGIILVASTLLGVSLHIRGEKLLETPGAIYTKTLVGRVWKVLEMPRDFHTSLHYGGRHERSPRLSREF
ncbi:hypothetical protein CK203_107485 [Vitis vinifera]|uniref:DUF7794 domain-containing protein n=1 Tax=Vitis vinifera TaxID=29760 RepID=A0A438CIU1_VITVI|nr:hypothetical protein CK203_107485 [Vitis vinifera]